MDLAYLIYRLANDDRLVSRLQEQPQETLAGLQLSLDQAATDAVLAVLQHPINHHGLCDSIVGPGDIDWTARSRPRQSLTA